jgi:cytochrome c oxidase cbb3-type subunit 3
MRRAHVILTLAALAVFASCDREDRSFHVTAPGADAVETVRTSDLYPGQMPATTQAAEVLPAGATINKYDENAWAISQGKRLYSYYNCKGCHAHGGGDIGPPLMDAKWIYGSNPDQIFSTIVQGRPNGMPSFMGKIPNDQVWQLVAYVRSLSGLTNPNASPGRDEHMQTKPAENSVDPQPPVNSNPSRSGEMPQ